MGNNCCSYEQSQQEISGLSNILKNGNRAPIRVNAPEKAEHEPPSTVAKPTDEMNKINEAASIKLKDMSKFNINNYEGKSIYTAFPILGPYEYGDGAIYYGQYKNGKRHGRGEQVWPDGSVYRGYWHDDQSSGPGVHVYSSGDMYFGAWKMGMSSGLIM